DYVVQLADGRSFAYAGGTGYLIRKRRHFWPGHADVRYESDASIEGQAPRLLHVRTVLRNVGSRGTPLSISPCEPLVHVWRDSTRTGAPVWPPKDPPPETTDDHGAKIIHACITIAITGYLAPGDTLAVEEDVPLADIFRSGVPDGRYWITVGPRARDVLRRRGMRALELDAGWADVRRAIDSVPHTRQLDALRAEAAARFVRYSAGADSVRTVVLLTNASRDSAAIDLV